MKKKENNGRNGDQKSLKPVEVVYHTCREHNKKPHKCPTPEKCQLRNCARFKEIFENVCTDSRVDTPEKQDLLLGVMSQLVDETISQKGVIVLKKGFKNVVKDIV